MFERFETREDIELTTKTKRIKKANLYMQYAAENFTSKELRAVYYSAIGEKVPDAAKDESGKFQNSDIARLLFNVKGRKLLYKVIKSFQTLIQAKKLTDVISISSSSPKLVSSGRGRCHAPSLSGVNLRSAGMAGAVQPVGCDSAESDWGVCQPPAAAGFFQPPL